MYSYSVKVRTKTYLWGSAGVVVGLDDPLLLMIHNDPRGDEIVLTAEPAAGGLGTLQPGECWTYPLKGLTGLFADCDADSTVSCTIMALRS
ncbi:hypothetical protein [Devosia sp. 919]|uniref:hypothetical protein n=1 Tax=Devosia sp. 919 TaxID=2726065 RepID=UPI001555166D|nr:hypothetical protein [Devosia sp. 919]